jgi:hypothetical protein
MAHRMQYICVAVILMGDDNPLPETVSSRLACHLSPSKCLFRAGM